jgi:hypothetical protein
VTAIAAEAPHPITDTTRFTLLVLGVALVLLLPTLSFRVGVDQSVFLYIGSEILEGRWPYVATWEGDYPGMMFLQAGEIAVFGRSIAMFRVFDLLVQLVTVWLIYRITFRVSGRAGAVLAAGLYCLLYQSYGPWNTAQREGFATPFGLAGYWLYFTADRRKPVTTAFLIGLGLGIAVTFKPTMLALAWFYFPLLPQVRWSDAKLIGFGLAGLVLPSLAFVGFYAAIGKLTDLYQATIAYQPIYTARLRGDRPLLLHWLSSALKLGRQSVMVMLGYLPFLADPDRRRERLMLYCAYLGCIAMVVVQGTFAGYHYLPGMAVGSILIGTGFTTVVGWARRRWPRLFPSGVREVALAALLVGLLIPKYMSPRAVNKVVRLRFLNGPAPGEFRVGTVFDFSESYDAAQYLRERTRPDDRIQIWGYEPLVYYLSERDAASRFQITHPLVMRVPGRELSPMQAGWRAEFLRQVAELKPRYVGVVRGDAWWWAPDEKTSEQLLDDFPEWKAYIASHYELERTIGRFLLYRRAKEGTDP